MLKLLIFDLDGTLADTSQDITDALNYALEPFGPRTYSVEETKAMVGSGISNLLHSLVAQPARNGDDVSAMEKDVVSRFLDFYSRHLLDKTTAYPGVKETLPRLPEYRKAVLSNKRAQYSREILEGLGIARYFDVIWGSDSVREKKPSPVPVLDLLARFSADREEAAVVGDSNYDVEASKAAGVRVVAVTYGFRSREVLKDADCLIDRFDDLLNVLTELNQKR
ncbi:MAG: HAD-IA family hydrolase [Nitrospiraceae bacterium]|nr:MAG: HAD-IA family hydrolase [Nitrospiraceae bacterium]